MTGGDSGYNAAVAALGDVYVRSGSPAARWAAEFLAVPSNRRAALAAAGVGQVRAERDSLLEATRALLDTLERTQFVWARQGGKTAITEAYQAARAAVDSCTERSDG